MIVLYTVTLFLVFLAAATMKQFGRTVDKTWLFFKNSDVK